MERARSPGSAAALADGLAAAADGAITAVEARQARPSSVAARMRVDWIIEEQNTVGEPSVRCLPESPGVRCPP
jgi:hypothetical protein